MKRSSQPSSHPRRPRGSQSGREIRCDESFQARAEEPLGTDFHRTISQRSSECWFLIGNKKMLCIIVPNRRNSFSCVLFVSSYTTAIVSPQLPSSFVLGNLSFSTFQKRRIELPMSRKNVSGVIIRSNSVCTEKFCF